MDMPGKIAITAAILSLLLFNLVFAGGGWHTDIRVRLLDAENRLIIGQRPEAADEWNARYDVPALLFGDIMAYIEEPGGGRYWRKIKNYREGYLDTKIWDLVVESPLEGEMVKLNWNSSNFPTGMKIILVDTTTGNEIDMKIQAEYSYQNVGKRKFQVEVQH